MATETAPTMRPMNPEEYAGWHDQQVADYAADMIEHGDMPPQAANRKAIADFTSLLTSGLETPGHLISVLELGDDVVGWLWVAERMLDDRRILWIYSVGIDEAFRGRGLGRAAMLFAEDEARRRGIGRIELNVFGGNAVARGLYRSLGYVERAVSMGKDLQEAPSA